MLPWVVAIQRTTTGPEQSEVEVACVDPATVRVLGSTRDADTLPQGRELGEVGGRFGHIDDRFRSSRSTGRGERPLNRARCNKPLAGECFRRVRRGVKEPAWFPNLSCQ